MTKIQQAQAALVTGVMTQFTPRSQRSALLYALLGEEKDAIADMVLHMVDIIEKMPKTYETNNIDSKDKIVHLHYFKGSVDAWIVERDMGESPDQVEIGEQIQAYGKCTLFGGGIREAEWGYISIRELIDNGVELDLYWEPRAVKEIE